MNIIKMPLRDWRKLTYAAQETSRKLFNFIIQEITIGSLVFLSLITDLEFQNSFPCWDW